MARVGSTWRDLVASRCGPAAGQFGSSLKADVGLAKRGYEMIQAFPSTELGRLFGCLDRLMPHIEGADGALAVTGGVGIQLGMAMLGRQGPRSDIADLDLVAASIDVIRPSVVGPFLVSHYHVVGLGVPKFMIQLVDPVTGIRVDVFPDLTGSLVDARPIAIGGHTIPVLPLERILEHKVRTLSRASSSTPVDPKHLHDARALGDVLGREAPSVASTALARDVYGVEADGLCERCQLSAHSSWPLAPKGRIFEILGWNRQPNQPPRPTAATRSEERDEASMAVPADVRAGGRGRGRGLHPG